MLERFCLGLGGEREKVGGGGMKKMVMKINKNGVKY